MMKQTAREVQTHETTKRVHCSEIWGGIRNFDNDVATRPVTTSLFSSSSSGRKGGDIYYFSVCDNDAIARIALADVSGHGDGSSLNFPVKSPYGSPRSVKLLIPSTCLAGEARCEAPRLS